MTVCLLGSKGTKSGLRTKKKRKNNRKECVERRLKPPVQYEL
jgi:hypothetical protein